MSKKIKVRYCAPFLDHSGYGEAARNYIFALMLYQDNIDLTLSPLLFDSNDGRIKDNVIVNKFQGFINCIPSDKVDINIVHAVPDITAAKNIIGNAINISLTIWEFSALPEPWLDILNLFDHIIVPTNFAAEPFIKAGYKNVHIIPHCFDIDEFDSIVSDLSVRNDIVTQIKNGKSDAYMFYSIFQWIERKNPYALLHAYYSEFSNKDNVVLILKTYRSNHSDSEIKFVKNCICYIQRYTGIPLYKLPKVIIIPTNLSRSDMLQLHKELDCFVSTSRGEGWGLPLTEALLTKTPVITPRYGGYMDFCDDENCYLVDYRMEPYHESHYMSYNHAALPFHNIKFDWCDVDVIHLRQLMRYVYNNRTEANEKALNGRKRIVDKYNYKEVGERFYNYLLEVNNNDKG